MKPLDMQAESYVATGNIASEGMRNQLGRPRLDRLSLLVREAAQNSWDAKAPDSECVEFGIAARTLSRREFEFLDQVVFAERPPTHATDATAAASLGQTIRDTSELIEKRVKQATGLRLLTVFDRGTTGLGGPTRADVMGKHGEPRDFVDFFRNVGTPPDKAQGGGTFGYGKAALYLSSSAHTILVHTRTKTAGRLQSRFMGSALTNHYTHDGGLFTGRHWWGRRNGSDRLIEPLTGTEADAAASRLGLPGYEKGTCGTTIAIVAPDFGEWEPAQACEYMAWQLAINFWPKMIPWPNEDEPRMRFQVSWEGEDVPVPDPTTTPPLEGFADALQRVRQSELDDDQGLQLHCLRPKKLLGRLALEKCYTRKSELAEFADEGTVPDIHTRVHHVALLRRPELVVEYRSFGALPSDTVGYAGVFLADSSMDRVFAGAEPPTHDSWNPTILNDKRYRTFVRTSFKRIDESVREFIAPASVAPPPGNGGPLAGLADHLGSVLIGIEGPGASIQPSNRPAPKPKGGRPKRSAKPKIEVRDTGRIEIADGMRVRVFEVDVRHAKGTVATGLTTKLGTALLGGGVEREPPAGAAEPTVVYWQSPAGTVVAEEGDLSVEEEGTWQLGVLVPLDSAVTLDIVALAGEG